MYMYMYVIHNRWMIPGWRMGWIIIHDRNNAFKDEVMKQYIDWGDLIQVPIMSCDLCGVSCDLCGVSCDLCGVSCDLCGGVCVCR